MWYAFLTTRGGPTRACIVKHIMTKPQNANQLAKITELDYKTVQHHLEFLKKNHIIVTIGESKYGAAYVLTEEVEEHKDVLEEIFKKIE